MTYNLGQTNFARRTSNLGRREYIDNFQGKNIKLTTNTKCVSEWGKNVSIHLRMASFGIS